MSIERTDTSIVSHLKEISPVIENLDHWKTFIDLYAGIRNRQDTVTARTLLVDLRKLLHSPDPEHQEPAPETYNNALDLVEFLTQNTHLENLTPEILYSLGYDKDICYPSLDALVVNARHLPEPLSYTLADEIDKTGGNVAYINPVGHYADGETRMVFFSKLTRPVDHLVILASTQAQQGGSFEVLNKAMRIARNPEVANQIKYVNVVIPTWGGSRGHRLGQDERLGFEILEAKQNAKLLALHAKDICERLKIEGNNVPQFRFFSVDIHNNEYPAKEFAEYGFEFHSISPAKEFAKAIGAHLKERDLAQLPVRFVACDQGAINRTEELAKQYLRSSSQPNPSCEIVYIDKVRKTAGEVSSASFNHISSLQLQKDGCIKVVKQNMEKYDWTKPCVIIPTDDMFDTCGTAAKDVNLLRSKFVNCQYLIFAATHGVFSKGCDNLGKIKANHYFVSNTLKPDGLLQRDDVTIVDMAPAITEAIKIPNKKLHRPIQLYPPQFELAMKKYFKLKFKLLPLPLSCQT